MTCFDEGHYLTGLIWSDLIKNKAMKNLSYRTAVIRLIIISFAWLLAAPVFTVAAQNPRDELAGAISRQLHHTQFNKTLYFPATVKRFYSSRENRQVWLPPGRGETGQAWQALMLLDCVLQYGLSHDDYHPAELTYDELRSIAEKPGSVSAEKKASFDILLTDAMLTLLDHLHYGKLNPELNAKAVDAGRGDLRLDTVLAAALRQPDLVTAMETVQPKSKAYTALQYWMYKWKGLYVGDCYEIPEEQVRLVAINMERLRWAGIADGPYIQVNIPTYTLSVFLKDTTYRYPVIVGSVKHPTPLLSGYITGIRAYTASKLASSLRVAEELPLVQLNLSRNSRSQLEFIFSSRYPIGLAEFNAPQWYKETLRAVTNGNIGIANGADLAAELLKLQPGKNQLPALRRVVRVGQAMTVPLGKPIPFKVTYLTCLIREGQLVTFDDIYQLDAPLQHALYHDLPQTTVNR
jgi:murein L,D-transpeptidase YcbB/YkuD